MRSILSVLLMTYAFMTSTMAQDAVAAKGPDRPTKDASDATTALASPDYVIGPQDVLAINVWHEPELTNSRVVVRPDGKIGLTLLNDLQANGLTTMQLRDRIAEGLASFVNEPLVSVVVLEIHSQVVFVNGAVSKPGVVALGGPMTVVELLIRSGGFTEFAKSEDIQILRKEGARFKRFSFNYKDFVAGKNYQQNIFLKNGDIVLVP